MEIKTWRLDPGRVDLRKVLDWVQHEQGVNRGVNRLLAVVRMEDRNGRWLPLEPGADIWVGKHLRAFLIESFLAEGWPGTSLRDIRPAFILLS